MWPPLWFSNGSSADTQIRSSLAGSATRGSLLEARNRETTECRLPLVVGRIIDEELLVFLVLGMESQAEQALFVAPVDLVGQLEKELLVAGRPLVGKRPDRGRVLLGHEQEIAAVVGIAKATGGRIEVGERDFRLQTRQRFVLASIGFCGFVSCELAAPANKQRRSQARAAHLTHAGVRRRFVVVCMSRHSF